MITTFDTDTIFRQEFSKAYDTFCEKEDANDRIPCTKRAMAAMNVQFERLSLSVIKSTDGTLKLDLSKIDDDTYNPDTNPMTGKWYFYDLLAIIMHFLFICVLMAPFMVIVLMFNNYHAVFSTRDVDQFLIFQDV